MNPLAYIGQTPIGKITPRTLDGASSATANTGWMKIGGAGHLIALGGVGNLGAGASAALTWEQATDSSGTSAKALSSGVFASNTLSADDANWVLQGASGGVDVDGGFDYVRATVTSAVGDAPCALYVFAGNPIHMTGSNPSTD